MSTQCPANEVVLTTARLLNAINAKYMSADPASFSYAAYSLSQTTAEGATVMDGSTVLTLPDPASFTQVPPVYIDEAALDAELTKNSKLYSTEALPPTWAQTYHYSVTEEEAADATGASAAALCHPRRTYLHAFCTDARHAARPFHGRSSDSAPLCAHAPAPRAW